MAIQDSDQWVSLLAEMMQTFPATGSLNTDIGKVEENQKIFADLIDELKGLSQYQYSVGIVIFISFMKLYYITKSVAKYSFSDWVGDPLVFFALPGGRHHLGYGSTRDRRGQAGESPLLSRELIGEEKRTVNAIKKRLRRRSKGLQQTILNRANSAHLFDSSHHRCTGTRVPIKNESRIF